HANRDSQRGAHPVQPSRAARNPWRRAARRASVACSSGRRAQFCAHPARGAPRVAASIFLFHRPMAPVLTSAAPTPSKPYRYFFIAGIAVVLTVGAAWGGWRLLQIAAAGRFTGASLFQVNAHGHAQVFGWVGLFVMGFGYQM